MSTAGECNDDPGGGENIHANCEGLEELLGDDGMFEDYALKVANDEVIFSETQHNIMLNIG